MAQEPGKIKEHIDAERERLGQDLEEIEHRVKDVMDWRLWYEKNTALMLGAAVAGGFLVSTLIGRSSSHNGSDAEPRFQPQRVLPSAGPKFSQLGRIGEVLDNTFNALIGVGASKLQDYVSETIPGFREQYYEAQRSRTH